MLGKPPVSVFRLTDNQENTMFHHPETQDLYLPWADRVFRVNPYPWYDKLRTEHPVYRMENGETVLTRYHDVLRWLKAPLGIHHFGKGPWNNFDHTVLNCDPRSILRCAGIPTSGSRLSLYLNMSARPLNWLMMRWHATVMEASWMPFTSWR
ncbi:hypothetical protein LRM35_21870 [Klebsiella variicola subsp. variicola]|nr:hypothetical protein LRM35_21870 [Klebsiella variicola subsp. variicola]